MTQYFQDLILSKILIFLVSFISITTLFAAVEVDYDVHFIGVPNHEIQTNLETVSILVSLKDRPPTTTTGLHRRADADIPELVKVMRSFGYYDAAVKMNIELDEKGHHVNVIIEPGVLYHLSSFKVVPYFPVRLSTYQEKISTELLENITIECLELRLGGPALAADIIMAKENLILLLADFGYPLAELGPNQEVIVDQKTKEVHVIVSVDTGPQAYFGPVTVIGLSCVYEAFVRAQIAWCEGSVFDPALVSETEMDLVGSELFSFVRITFAEDVDENGLLPMIIELKETRFRSYSVGLSYATELGPGLDLEWEHRNIDHMGRRFTFKTEIWKDVQQVALGYRRPNFLCREQDLVWVVEYINQDTLSFDDTSFSISATVERWLSERSTFYYGLMLKYLKSNHSDNLHGDFTLLKAPLQYVWSCVNDTLDPSRGKSFNFRMAPTIQIIDDNFFYLTSQATLIFYKSLYCDNWAVLAAKIESGSIAGADRATIPAPERFYSGTENTLRGYKYLTVSPLDATGFPIGGLSMMVLSLEPRFKVTDAIGFVGFYEVGNVFAERFPTLNQKMLQSIGTGIRYYTAVGPIRFDIAFPLNRRKGLDPAFQLYFSIGHTF